MNPLILLFSILFGGGLLCTAVFIGLSRYFAWKERRVMAAKRKQLDWLLDME